MQATENWSLSSPQDQDPTPIVEYETQANLWLPRPGIATGRKLQSQQRKKGGDKKDSQLSALGDGSPRKLRERASWLGMSKGYGVAASGDGQWVKVRCNLIETDERECRLTIIGDKETLQHSLNVRHLHYTDIRFADRSLLFRNDCLCITAPQHAFHAHSPSLQAVMSLEYTAQRSRNGMPALDPILLAFENQDAAHTWCAILRSYAVPEIYGCDVEKPGLYRMWRQVTLSILNAKNVGLSKKPSNPNLNENGTISVVNEEVSDVGPDLQMYCEIMFDGVIVARTMHQKGQAANSSDPSPMWTWHETFTLSDLPPFGMMLVRVWVKKGSKEILVGTVEMVLAHPRRGQLHEGWYPIMSRSLQVGGLRMKIMVDEEHILPSEEYASITSALDQCNCLDMLSELDQQLRLSEMSIHMLSLAVGRGTFAKDIYDLAQREVQNAANPNTLFRGNTIFTKTVEHAMTFFGRTFLEASVGPSIQGLISERVELETDPSRNLKGAKDVETSVKLLPIWCSKFWSHIFSMREHCPPELRMLFKFIRELVEERFKDNEDATNLKWQSVSAFCFLRLIVPAILHPHLWGLYPGLPSPGLQRSLTLIAKVLQSLANLAKDKRDNQQGIGTFLEQNRPHMIDYINSISSTSPDRAQSFPRDKYDRTCISTALKTRREEIRSTLPLHSESIPVLPHLLDIPKHLAIVTSAVTRHARANPQSLGSRPLGMVEASLVEDFALRCFEIEDKILGRVKRVEASLLNPSAAEYHPPRKNSSSPGTPGGPNCDPSENSSSGPNMDEVLVRQPRELHRTRRSTGKRPSTAPARSSSADSVPAPPPMSPLPPSRLLRGSASDDSWASSPSMSPVGRAFGHQTTASATLALSHSESAVVDTECVPDIDSLDPARPRKAFFRSLLGR